MSRWPRLEVDRTAHRIMLEANLDEILFNIASLCNRRALAVRHQVAMWVFIGSPWQGVDSCLGLSLSRDDLFNVCCYSRARERSLGLINSYLPITFVP